MKKIMLSLFIVIVVFSSAVIGYIYTINYDEIYTNLMTSAGISKNSTNKINYKIQFLPIPSLVIEEIKENKKIEFKNIKIQFSLWSTLSFNYEISNIEIGEVKIHLANNDVNYIDHDKFISELIKKEAFKVSAKVHKLIFVESDQDIPFIIENFLFSGGRKVTKFTGNLSSGGNVIGEFVKDFDKVNFNLNFDNHGYNIKLKEIYEKSVLKKGKLEIITSALTNEIMSLLPDFVNLSDQFISNEKVKVSLDIMPSDKFINFNNIIIQSESIYGVGEISLSRNHQDLGNVKMNFSKINLDSWKKNNRKTANKSAYYSNITSKMTNIYHNMNVDISVERIILDPNDIITDIKLKFLHKDGRAEIKDFFGTFDKNGGFRVNGIVSKNSFRSLFEGKVAIIHKDLNNLAEFIGGKKARAKNNIPYSLVSDIKFSSVDISMQNLLIKTNSSEITGFFSAKFIGNSPRINSNLKINKANLDKEDLPLLKYLYNYALSFTQDSKKEEYLNKFIPLREVKSINDYDISFDQLTLNDKIYKNCSFNLTLTTGKLKLQNLILDDGANNVDASLELVASFIRPSFYLTIHSGTLEVDFLSPKSILSLKNQILEKFALNKVDLLLDFNLDKIYQNNLTLGRLILKAKNNDTLFEISKFNADMFGGRIYSTGSILLSPYTINFVYALNSAIIPEIAKLMPKGFIKTGGGISIRGMLSTNGQTLAEQLYNLYTKSSVIAKDITINNFSIDDLVQNIVATDYNLASFEDDVKEALLTGKTEIGELKSDIELTRGLLSFKNMAFKTKYTAASSAATMNIYDMNIDLSSIFSFYLPKPTNYASSNNSYNRRSSSNYTTTKLILKATGNFFTPKKEANTKELENLLQELE